MIPVEVLWTVLGCSLVCSFLCSLFLFRFSVLSDHELRTLFRTTIKSDEAAEETFLNKLDIAFRQARILSYTIFFSMSFWLMLHQTPSFLDSFPRFLMGMFAIFVLLWSINLILPRLLAIWMNPRPGVIGMKFSRFMYSVMLPLTWIAVSLGSGMQTRIGDEDRDRAAEFEEEIRTLIDEGEKKGIFDEDEGDLFQSLVEFSDTIVREVMTPRLDIVAIEKNTTVSELIKRIIEGGFTRIPVYQERIDDIVGVVFAKDLLNHWGKAESEMQIEELLREAYFIPETKKITHLLKEFQREKIHMAIVVDEYGGVSGLVTIEDLLEEIVGEIRDEYDNETDMMEILEDKSITVDARINVEEIEEYFDITIASEDFDTIGGLIFHILGRVPIVGESIQFGDLEMKVLSVEERRVRMIHIKRVTVEAGTDGNE